MAQRRTDGQEAWSMDLSGMGPWNMDPWTRTMTSGIRFWLSFWPVAPLFGVEWRFAELAGTAGPGARPGAGERNKTAVERAVALGAVPAAKAAEAMSEMVEAAVTPVDAVAEAAAPARARFVEDRTDDLTRIKGIGPGLARQLNDLGIRNFAQLAALTKDELTAIDAKLTSIKGRCFRDDWLGQAKALAG